MVVGRILECAERVRIRPRRGNHGPVCRWQLTDAAGIPQADGIARWTGTAWSALGSDPSGADGALVGRADALAVSGSDVYVGGGFRDAAGIADADSLARWDGSAWHAIGSSIGGGSFVSALAVSGPDLYVGGDFRNGAGIPGNNYLARWDGSGWHAVGDTRALRSEVYTLLADGSSILAGGYFDDVGDISAADKLARWDGSAWHAVGELNGGVNGAANGALYAVAGTGSDLYIGGEFVDAAGIAAADRIAHWDGSAWLAVGPPSALNSDVDALVIAGSDLYVGGYFTNAAGIAGADYLARWDGTSWHAVGPAGALNSPVFALAVSGSDLYVGGDFTNAAGIVGADRLARWDGSTWHSVGPAGALSGRVRALAVSGSGLYVAGDFTNAAGIAAADYLARWDGSAWASVGSTSAFTSAVRALALWGPDLYAAASGAVAHWDGSEWHALGGPSGVSSLAIAGSVVYAGGSFTNAAGIAQADYIALWDGSGWTAVGSNAAGTDGALDDSVTAIAVVGPHVYVGGAFWDAAGIGEADYIADLYDTTAPAVTTFALKASSDTGGSHTDGLTNSATLVVDLVFSEPVTGVSSADITMTGTASGCSIAAPSGSSKSWTVDISSCSEGTVTLAYSADGVVDPAGNSGPVSPESANVIAIDRTAPTSVTLSAVTSSPTTDPGLLFRLAASEDLDCLSLVGGDLLVTNGAFALGAISDFGTGCDIEVTSTVADGDMGTTSLAASGTFGITDEAGNATSSVTGSPSILVNRSTPKAISFESSLGSPTNSTSIDYTLVFSESVSGIDPVDFSNSGTATGCTFLPSAQSGIAVTVTVTTCDTTGTLIPRLAANAVVDDIGNPGPADDVDASTPLVLDRNTPTVTTFALRASSDTGNSSSDGLTQAATLVFDLGFSEAVADVTAEDVTQTSGSATGCAFDVTGSGTTYEVTADSCSEGTVVLRFAAYGATDTAANDGPTDGVETAAVTIDRTAPALTLSAVSVSPTTSADLLFRLAGSDDLDCSTLYSPADLSVIGGTIGAITGVDGACDIAVSSSIAPGAAGSTSLAASADAFSVADVAGNVTSSVSGRPSVTVDRSAPTVTTFALRSSSDTGGSTSDRLTAATTLVFDLVFSEAVAGVTAEDITQTSGTTTGCVLEVTGSGTTYEVTADSCGEGTLAVRFAANGASDAAGNSGPATDANTAEVTVDRTAPSVTDILLDPISVAPGGTVAVSASATDDHAIASGQVRVDDGTWGPVQALDGTFDGATETLSGTVTAPIGDEVEVCVRVTDSAGNQDAQACATLTITGAAALAAGSGHTCTVLADGSARCWGANTQGQLGDGLIVPSALPVAVRRSPGSLLGEVRAIVAGSAHSCALLADRTVVCWGDNAYGQLGDGTTTDRRYATRVPGLANVTRLAAGATHTCALLSNATVRCWGRNNSGQLGDGTKTTRRSPVRVTGLTRVTQLAAGAKHTCARVSGGTVRCWGANAQGQLGDGTRTTRLRQVPAKRLTGVSSLAAGTAHTCARLTTGAVRCWGDNAYGQLGDGTRTDRSFPVAVKTVSTARSVAAATNQTCVVLADHSVRCWGANAHGQLGDGTTTTRLSPTRVTGLAGRTVLGIAMGSSHTCARLSTGGIVCWGANSSGQLGAGSTGPAAEPVEVRRQGGDARDVVTIEPVEPPPTPQAIQEPTPTPTPTPEPTPLPTLNPVPDPTPSPRRDPDLPPTSEPEPAPTREPESPQAPEETAGSGPTLTPEPAPEG